MLFTLLLLIPIIGVSIIYFFKLYWGYYKIRLAKLLGKDSVSDLYTFIFTSLVLSVVLLLLLFMLLGLLVFISLFSEPSYCTEPVTEPRDELLDKISKLEKNVQYFSDQAKETDWLFKQALRDNLPEDFKQERLQAKRESETNLNTEKKILRTLKNRLNSGNFDSSISTSSSLGKRNLDE